MVVAVVRQLGCGLPATSLAETPERGRPCWRCGATAGQAVPVSCGRCSQAPPASRLSAGGAVLCLCSQSGGSAEMGKTAARSLLHAHDHRAGVMQWLASQVTIASHARSYSTACEVNAAQRPLCACSLATGTFKKLFRPVGAKLECHP